jgi:predicted nucleotidyltransferase
VRCATPSGDYGAVSDYEEVLTRATADPRVRGLVLTGSYARGLATAHSDHELVVVVDDRNDWPDRRSATLDEIVYTVDGLADTSLHWQRYAFRGAQVLLDRLDGGIAERVARQATPTEAEAAEWARENLDGLVNQLYRAAKSRRDGEELAARLDELESVPWLLATVFTLHGRLRPYNKYLHWELSTFPLPGPWDDTLPARAAADPAALFPDVAQLARRRGHGDVLDSWGDKLALLLPAH